MLQNYFSALAFLFLMLFVAVCNYFLSLHKEAYIQADSFPEQDVWASWVQVERRVLSAGQWGSLFPHAYGDRFLSGPRQAGASCSGPWLLAGVEGLVLGCWVVRQLFPRTSSQFTSSFFTFAPYAFVLKL